MVDEKHATDIDKHLAKAAEEGDTQLSNVRNASEASPDVVERKLKAQQSSTERFLQKFAQDEVRVS